LPDGDKGGEEQAAEVAAGGVGGLVVIAREGGREGGGEALDKALVKTEVCLRMVRRIGGGEEGGRTQLGKIGSFRQGIHFTFTCVVEEKEEEGREGAIEIEGGRFIFIFTARSNKSDRPQTSTT